MLTGLMISSAALFVAPDSAEPVTVQRGPAPEWVKPSSLLPVPSDASGPVFFRRQDVEVQLDDRGQAQYLGYRIKILNSSALQVGNISIAWNPASGRPIVHNITVYREGIAIDVLQKTSFEVLRREDQLEAAKLDGTLTAVLRVPDLRVGDELEVAFTSFVRDATLGDKNSGVLFLGGNPAPGRYHLSLGWPRDRKPFVKATPDLAAAMTSTPQSIDLRFDDPPVSSPPKDAPLRYQWRRALEYSDFADWGQVSRLFAPLFGKAATLATGSPVRDEAKRIAAAHPTPLARAAAALKLVQQDVRYIYIGLNGGNLTPASADETWQRRYGDCKGKTALLLALLGQLGIDAEPVLVNSTGSDDGLDQRLPSPQFFDHVVVRARIGGTAYWLDGTLPPVVPPGTRPVVPFRWVLPLQATGSTLERLATPSLDAPNELHLVDIDAQAGFDVPARIKTSDIVRGIEGLKQQVQFSALTPGQLLEAFRQNSLGDFWQAIDSVDWHYDQAAAASVLTIRGTGIVNWDHDGDGRSYALPGGGFSPPERRLRAPDQQQDAPYYSAPDYTCHVTTVHLPSTTQPRQWSSKPSYDTRLFGRHYHRAWELRDGTIRMVRGSRIEQPEIDAATARADNNRIAAFDNSMGWIQFTPGQQKAAVGAGEKVPTAFGFDWLADATACMSPPGS